MNLLITVALLLPLLALAGLARERTMRYALVIAPLPLLALALLGRGELALPNLLFGSSFAVDAINRPLLLLAALGWALAGWYAGGAVKKRPRVFALYWLVTLAGQGMALLGADLAAFYLGYAVMTVGAYGLIVHERSGEALHAGRVYVVLAMLGEALVLAGLLALGAAHGNIGVAALADIPQPGAWSLLLLAGFAVKLGIVPLHVWLPLAHPVAPVPASAVLSGVIVKAGLLGMLRFVPAGSLELTDLLIGAGMFTAAYGALVGLFQSRLKTVLAYSTISQMGIALVGFAGVQAGFGVAAVGLFALHTGLNKVTLFLASGHRLRGWVGRVFFILPAAALAGLPLTSGMAAKDALKVSLKGADWWLVALGASSVLTTALLAHAYTLATRQTSGRERPHPAWVAGAAAGLIVPWSWGAWQGLVEVPSLGALWPSLWPVAVGLGAYLLGRKLLAGRDWTLPEGDIVAPLHRAGAHVGRVLAGLGDKWNEWEPDLPEPQMLARPLRKRESAMGHLAVAGLCLLMVVLGLWLTMIYIEVA